MSFRSGIIRGEFPTNGSLVALGFTRGDPHSECCRIRNMSVETLGVERTQLDLNHVEPAPVFSVK